MKSTHTHTPTSTYAHASTPTLAPTQTNRRRGIGYVLILTVAMIVSIIGLSSLMATRIQRRAFTTTEDASQADLLANSYLDVVLLRLRKNPIWRTTHLNGIASAPETIDEASCVYYLLDEIDNNLANDATQPVRLVARATVGGAIRSYSVKLDSPGASTPTNLLTNGDMENGTTGWQSWNCNLVSISNFPAGGRSIYIQNRSTYESTAYQDVTGLIQNGQAYDVKLSAVLFWGGDLVTIGLKVTSSGSGTQMFAITPTYANSNWTAISGTLTPTWSGTLTDARWQTFTSPDGGAADYIIDNAAMTIPGDNDLVVVFGSRRREITP